MELYQKAECLLEHYITEYVGSHLVSEYKIPEYTMNDAAEAAELEQVLHIKWTALSYVKEAYQNKDKDLLFSIFTLLNLSGFGFQDVGSFF